MPAKKLNIVYVPHRVDYPEKEQNEAEKELESVLQYIWQKLIFEKQSSDK